MQKQEIRRNMKELKSKLTLTEQEHYSERIIRCLQGLTEYRLSEEIFCYVNFNQEVITTRLIEEALSGGKRIAVPKIIDKDMRFYYISSLKELETGILGIPEPFELIRKAEAVPDPEKDNLFIVPGLAFDPMGNRIGYGKGFYDNYFRKYSNCSMIKIALTYDFQVLPLLPKEDQDIKIDQIITQDGLIKTIK